MADTRLLRVMRPLPYDRHVGLLCCFACLQNQAATTLSSRALTQLTREKCHQHRNFITLGFFFAQKDLVELNLGFIFKVLVMIIGCYILLRIHNQPANQLQTLPHFQCMVGRDSTQFSSFSIPGTFSTAGNSLSMQTGFQQQRQHQTRCIFSEKTKQRNGDVVNDVSLPLTPLTI